MPPQEAPDDYEIATNRAHRRSEFGELVFARLGLDHRDHLEVDPGLYRPSELQVIYGDPAKAKAALGWRYDLSFEDLIARLVEDELSLPARAE